MLMLVPFVYAQMAKIESKDAITRVCPEDDDATLWTSAVFACPGRNESTLLV